MVEQELERLININSPIIIIKDPDIVRVDSIISRVVGKDDNVLEWNPSLNLVRFGNKEEYSEESLEDFLKDEAKDECFKKDRFLVLKEIQDLIDEPAVKYSLELIAQRRLYDPNYNTTVIIVSTVLDIPEELEKYVSFLEIPLPNDSEIDRIITSHIRINEYDEKQFTENDRKTLKLSLKGMSEFDMDRVLDMAMSSNGSLSAADNEMILRQKKEMVKRSGVIELVDTPDVFKGINEKEVLDNKEVLNNSIGGIDALKKYLLAKARIFNEIGPATQFGVKMPKGIFLVGMPGCGKSLCAKVTASIFGVPLLKMDMGSLMGKYVGTSEENMRKAIKTAEAASPCVLWIDEIEKAFNGVGGENAEVLTRMFGYFLSWMQEKKTPVYVVATANNAENLPPELKRKGRFDEIFCVNLPEDAEREAIFKVHLGKLNGKKCYNPSKDIDLSVLVKETKGFNGADIEAVVNEAVERQYLADEKPLFEKEPIDTSVLLSVIADTISITMSCEKQIESMRQIFAESSFKDAYSGDVTKPKTASRSR